MNKLKEIIRNIILNIFGSFKKPSNGIHIINAHYITPDKIKETDGDIFEKFIKVLKKKCKIISIQNAVKLIQEGYQPNESLVALTFDDGFEECYTLIAPILDKYNIKVAFFINSNFIESNESYQFLFNKRVNTFTKKPMNWYQIKKLHLNGHVIGSHSLDHFDFGKISHKELIFQLDQNKKELEKRLCYQCEYFAWTYGKFANFPLEALKETLKHHKIIMSSDNSKEYFSYNRNVINRRHIEPFWNKRHINYFLHYSKK